MNNPDSYIIIIYNIDSLEKVPKTPPGGCSKMGAGQMIFPTNVGSVHAIDHFWRECSSKVIFSGRVEIQLVDFLGECGPISSKLGGGKTFHLKCSRMVGGRHLFQKNGGR